MVAVYTWEDVPKKRFSIAGQTFPEPSPYDRLILDRHVRSVGDAVAIVVGESEKAVDKALNMIKVKYTVLEPVLDFRKSLDNKVLVHPEDDWSSSIDTGDVKRNLIHHEEDEHGNVEKILSECDEIIEHTYRIKAAQQAYMETCRAYCEIDRYGRLHCISSTQIVFHLRRILANALDIPKSMVRAEKPRIGGGFGAKQTAVCEVYPAFVTWKTKRPSKIIYSRKECQTIASPRHEMEVTVRLGAMKDGHIRAIDLYTLSNGGAYGEHSTTTVGLSGHKSLPLYTGGCEATRFSCDVVYTNVQAAGAYRGYGATQGIFALESTVNELAEKLHIDPVELRLKNIVREGMFMPAYFGETANACALDRCIMHCADNFHWAEKYPVRDMGNGKVRAAGMALAGKIDNKDYRVYSLLGDGEIEEGQVWEAAMFASHNNLDNLCLIVDFNGLQIDGKNEDVMTVTPIDEKFKAFGFHVLMIDGHDFGQIFEAFDKAAACKGKPTVIIAKTNKGRGVSFMQDNPGWHGKAPKEDEAKQAVTELGGEW